MDLIIDASSIINLDNGNALEGVCRLQRCRLWVSPLALGECLPPCGGTLIGLSQRGLIELIGPAEISGDTFVDFPSSFLAASDAASFRWRQDFIRTYLEREMPRFGPRLPAETLRRLWTMLAHTQGELLNAANLARALGVDGKSVARYLDLLVDLLLVRRLPPWHRNAGKRLVKSPKVYVRDSGVVHALLRLASLEDVLGHPVAGRSWEGMVIESILGAAPAGTDASFYRSAAGAEVDLVLELPGARRWVIEIKRSSAPKVARGFYNACQDLRPQGRYVVYNGSERYPVGAETEALGLRQMLGLLT